MKKQNGSPFRDRGAAEVWVWRSLTFFRQSVVQHHLAMTEVVQHRGKIVRVAVDQIGARFVLKPPNLFDDRKLVGTFWLGKE